MVYKYEPIDRYITLNDGDVDLFPIRIDIFDLLCRTHRQYNLPEPIDFPSFSDVCGYGVDPADQVWEHEVIPESLIRLERQIRNDLKKEKRITAIKIELTAINNFWDEIESNPDKWAVEIAWIQKMWEYRLLGKFIFIRGKVHYLPGTYWFFLNFYTLDDAVAEFRYWDCMMLTGWKFAQLDTTTFKNIDSNSRKPIANEDGTYEMVDIGRRVCLGVNDPKARRVGDTSKAVSFGMEEVTRRKEYHFGEQGRDEAHAKKVFQQQFIRPFGDMPIFFRPTWDSDMGVRPKEKIEFISDTYDSGLKSMVTHALSANAENYNGTKLHYFHRDEAGSTANENVNIGHGIIKICLMLGDKIIGFCTYTSTVDKIESGSAGENYMNLCFSSHYENRNENGMTPSGMYNIFIPAELRMEGYIDKYGYPIADTPTPEQARFIGKDHGAITWIENTSKDHKRKKNWEELAIHQRQYPRKFRQAFSPPGKNQFFNVEFIRNRIQHLQFVDRTQLPERGDFVWSGGFGSDVQWVANDNGRWFLSKTFNQNETNRRRQIGGIWYPDNRFSIVHSADTFGSDRTLGRASMGGLAARWLHDQILDPVTRDSAHWKSGRLIITYKFRPDSVEEFAEDCLKQNIYCGGLMYAERNKDHIDPYYRSMGYGGYLLYDYDHTGRQKGESSGFYTKEQLKIKIFNLVRDELNKNVDRTNHVDWLTECSEILDPQKMTDFDLFTAVGGTLLAEQNPYYQIMAKNQNMRVNTTNWIQEEVY